jgi:large conductance mechanosensitive channel
MKTMKQFREFLLRGNLIDLAIAIVVGTAFAAVVKALVADLVTPLVAAIGGKANFENLYFSVHGSKFLYGDFVNVILTFIVIAAVIFFLVVKPTNAILGRLGRLPKEIPVGTCPQCLSDVPMGATRCMYCTSELEPLPEA